MQIISFFLQTHHKEICLTVDTAKLILAAFPKTTRLVVSGIGPEFQPSMYEMLDAVSNAAKNTSYGKDNAKCLVLFPTEDAITFDEIKSDMLEKVMQSDESSISGTGEQKVIDTNNDINTGWDVVVLDGTWSQARKIYTKYLQNFEGGCLYRVQLSNAAVKVLDELPGGRSNGIETGSEMVENGHQLRRHPIKVRIIGLLCL